MNDEENVISNNNRYVSLDFLRGIAIFLMLFFHLIINIMKTDWLYNLDTVPLFTIILTVIIIYFGAWRGFFVMISGIGHMISMVKARKRGVPIGNIILKQFLTGCLLLVFSMLMESYLGYEGYIGRGFLWETWDSWNWISRALRQGPITCVAWCLIINSIVFGFLMVGKGHTKPHRNAIILTCLVILSVVITNPMWQLHETITSSTLSIGEWHQKGFWHGLACIVVNPWGANPQPLFPYISLLFIGDIIGIYLAEDKPPKFLPRIGALIALGLVLIGISIGLIMKVPVIQWFPLEWPDRLSRSTIWEPWFLFITAGQLVVTMLFLRYIEYRGKGTIFAEKTKYIRRFGLITFTIFTFQWFEFLPRWIVGNIFNVQLMDMGNADVYIVMITLVVNFTMWALIFYFWEKIKYIGSFEWLIGQILVGINLLLAKIFRTKRKRIKTSKSDLRSIIWRTNWADLSNLMDDERKQKREQNLILSTSILSILFFPFIPVSILLLRNEDSKQENLKLRSRVSWAKMLLHYAIIQTLVFSLILMRIKGITYTVIR